MNVFNAIYFCTDPCIVRTLELLRDNVSVLISQCRTKESITRVSAKVANTTISLAHEKIQLDKHYTDKKHFML